MSISNYLTGIVTAAPKDQGYSVLDMEPDSTYMKNLAAEKAARLEEKKSRLSQYSNADRDSYTQLPNGNIEDNKNKIWNKLTDDEYASVFSAGVSEYGLQRQADGTYVDPRGKIYRQDQVTNLYGYGTKESDDAFKMGVAANVGDGSSDNRYLPGRAKSQGSNYPGWLSGAYGVDVSKKQFDIALPKDVAETLEKLQHGRQGAIEDRLYPDANDPMAEAMVGSGKSEYYKDMQSVLATKGTGAGLDYDAAKGLLEQYRGLNKPKTVTPGFGNTSVNSTQPTRTEDYFAAREADRMGVGDRLVNTLAGLGKSFTQNLVLDTADWAGETLKRQTGWGWDVGTEEEKADMASKVFGYNQVLAQRGQEKAKEHVTNLWNAATKEDVDFKVSDAFGLIKEVFTTPEMLGESIGYVMAMLPGVWGKAAKTASGLAKELSTLDKVKDAARIAEITPVLQAAQKQAAMGKTIGALGLVNVATGDVNDQIDEYTKNNNGVPPTASAIMFRMMPIAVAATALDKFSMSYTVGMAKDALGVGKEALREIVEEVPEAVKNQLWKKVGTTALNISKAAGVEAGQEYVQTMAEVFNKQYDTEKYGDDVGKILTSEENVVEALTGAAFGAGQGAQMRGALELAPAIGPAVNAIGDAATGVVDRYKTGKESSSEVGAAASPAGSTPSDNDTYVGILKEVSTDYDNGLVTYDNLGDYVARLETMQELRPTLAGVYEKNPALVEALDQRYKALATNINNMITSPNAKDSDLRLTRRLALDLPTPEATLGSQDSEVTFKQQEYTDADRKADAERLLHFVLGEQDLVTPELASKYSRFATANGIELERLNTIIKSYESVEDEASVGKRGWKTYETKIDALMGSSNPDKAALTRQYRNLNNWLLTTINSKAALEDGIKAAKARAHYLNSTPTFTEKPQSVVTGFIKSDNKPFDITVRKVNGKWVADTAAAEKLIGLKDHNIEEIKAVINKYNSRANQLITDINNVGNVIVPPAGSSDPDNVARGRKADTTFYGNQVAKLNSVLGVARGINKVVLDKESRNDTNGTKQATYSKKWAVSNPYHRVNGALINTSSYSEGDVVLLNAMGTFKLSNTEKVVSSLYAKNSEARQEINKVVAAKASIVLDREYIATKSTYFTKDGKKYKGDTKGQLNQAGKKVEEFLESQGYVRLPGTSAVFVHAESNKDKIAVAKKAVDDAKAAKTALTKAKNQLVDLQVKLDYAKEQNLGAEVVLELEQKIAQLRTNVLPAFGEESLAEVANTAEETDTEVEEQVDTDIGTVNDEDVDGTIRTEEQLEEAEETDTALLAEAKTIGKDRSQKLDSYINRRIREKLETVDNSIISAEAAYDTETGEWNKKAVDIILAAKKDTLDELQKEADAAVNDLLAAWNELVKEGLRGEELANKVKELVEVFDPRLKDVYGSVSYISKLLLDSALGANRPDMYEVSVRIVDSNGPRPHMESFMSEESAKKFIADTKKKYPTVTTKDDEGNVRETIPFVEEKKVIILSAPTKVVLDPNKIVAVAANKPTLLNTLPVEMLPGRLKAEMQKFMEYAKKRIKTITDTEKKDSEAIKQVDKSSKDDSSKFYLLNDPARGLMLNKNGDMSPQVAAAMYLAVGEAFVTDRMKLMLGHKDNETIARMFGVHETAVTSQMREHANKHGMLRKTLANALGKDILKQLGYVNKKDKDTGIGHYEALTATLGNMAIEAAIEAKLLQGTEVASKDLADMYGEGNKENANDFTGKEKTYYVNIASTKETNGKFERHKVNSNVDGFIGNYEKETEGLPGVKTRETGPVFTALTRDEIEGQLTSVRNDITGAHKIPEKAKKTLRHMMNTRYVLDVNRAKALLDVLDDEVAGAALKASLGYIEIDSDEYSNLAYKQKEVQPAINMGIDKSFEHIRSLVERAGNEEELSMWFKHYYSSNGRFMMDSNTVNPQTDKLMRFLVQPASHKVTHTVGKSKQGGVTFKVGNVDTSYNVRVALAQAFGIGIDKEKPLDTIKYGNVLLSLTAEQLETLKEAMLTKGKAEIRYTNNGVKDTLEVEAEHLTHTLQAIDFLLDVQKGGDVTSSLTAEFDALTSGFANKTQQFPVLADMTKHWERVGILTPELIDNYGMIDGGVFVGSISSVLSKEAKPKDGTTFLDSYQNLAAGVGRASEDKFRDIANGSSVVVKDKSTAAVNGIKSLAAAMANHLPKPNSDGTVSKDLRTLFKSPFMIFNYSAGIKTIVKNLSHDVVEEMLHKVAKDDPKGQAIGKALIAGGLAVDMGNGKFSKDLKDLVKLLRTEPITSYKLAIVGPNGKRFSESAYMLMNNIVNATFGSAVEDTFKENFGKFIEIQNYTNDAFKISFARFEFSFNDSYKKLLDSKGFVTEEEVQDIIKNLWDEFPWIKGPLTELSDNYDSIPVVDMDTRDPGIMSGRRTPQSVTEDKSGKAKYVTVHPIIKRLKAATSAGSVLPFHYIDGAQLGETINKINKGTNEEVVGVLPVHDAITMPIHMMDEINHTFNKVWYETGKEYSLIDAIVEMVDRWNTSTDLGNYQVKGLKVFQEEEKEAKRKGTKVDKSISRAQTLVTSKLKELQKEINDARDEYYVKAETPGKEFGYNNVVGTVGGAYFPNKDAADKEYLTKFGKKYLDYVTEVEGVVKRSFEDVQAAASMEDELLNSVLQDKLIRAVLQGMYGTEVKDVVSKFIEDCK